MSDSPSVKSCRIFASEVMPKQALSLYTILYSQSVRSSPREFSPSAGYGVPSSSRVMNPGFALTTKPMEEPHSSSTEMPHWSP